MVPGRRYTVGFIGRLLWRRRWMIAIPLAVFAGGAATISSLLPNLYRAETTILLISQRVPESYVRSTVSTRLEERLRTISQQILSRTRLEGLIKDFNLYPDLSEKLLMEQVVEIMRPQVTIELVRDSSFRIGFTYGDAAVAAKVTQRLATLFIEENLRDRELQADSTSRFLDAELNDARRRLIEQEKRLENYRKAHSGSLPSQLASNLQMIQTTQQSLTLLSDATNRLRDRRGVIERLTAEQQQAIEAVGVGAAPLVAVPPPGGNPPQLGGGTLAQQLVQARQNLQALELRLQPQHPDVLRAHRQLAELESRIRAAAPATPATPPAGTPSLPPVSSPPQSPPQMAAANRLRELEGERKTIDAQIASNEAQDSRLRETVLSYQSRLEQLPTRESEITELTRDYATLQASYQDLLSKRESSVVAANLERRQIGEQFRVIDPARAPEIPISPNRLMINAIGAALGLLFGLGTALLLEVFNTTLRTDGEVAAALGVATLAMVPVLRTSAELRRRRRRAQLEGLAVTSAALAAGGVAAWWFTLGSGG